MAALDTDGVPDTATTSAGTPPEELVIVALDGSHHAEKGLIWYIENVHKPNFTTLILNIAKPPYVKSEQMIYMSSDMWEDMINKEKLKFKKVEMYYAKKLENRNVTGSIRTVFYDDDVAGIIQVAEEENALMIVMGSHGTGLEQRLLGHVAENVTRHAHCPVLVWRHDHCSHTSKSWDKVLMYM